LTINTHLFW